MGASLKLVVDHLAGSRRGDRQILDVEERLRFGRHPDCDVAFDSHRDLQASSRHAELRAQADGGFVLRDVGSSNGTYVGGARVTLVSVQPSTPLHVAFGVDGPVLGLYLGNDDEVAELPEPRLLPLPGARAAGQGLILAVLITLIVAALVAIWWRFAS